VHSDPFAPATSERHIKNLTRVQPPLDGGDDPELVHAHVTPSELLANQMPDSDELLRRDTLVDEFRAELDEHGEAQNPTLVDLTDTEHVWHWVEPQGDEAGYFTWLPTSEVSEDADKQGDEDTSPGGDEKPATEGEAEPPAEKPASKPKRGSKGGKTQEELDAALAKLNAAKSTS
jgi:hypothetical protein